MKGQFVCLAVSCLFLPNAVAQSECSSDNTITGMVHDGTGALVVGAEITLDSSSKTRSNDHGQFQLRCIPFGRHLIHVNAETFRPVEIKLEVKPVSKEPAKAIAVTLQPDVVEVSVDVSQDERGVDSADGGGIAKTLSQNDLALLADDPDDFLRQLQTLAAPSGSVASATVTVDGFQMASRMPPKSAIAFIKVNPDLFSAEYAEPPYGGGRIEIYTKPGQSRYHGDVFFSSGDSFMNAKDPFASSRAAIGKKRYGFDLSGPVRKRGSDFSLSFEHRDIKDFAVVNATTLDSLGNQVQAVQNVPSPQALWLGSARIGWQLTEKNSLTATYAANVTSLENVGVGGTTLAESGYSSVQAEHNVRVSDVTTFSSQVMHEVRAALRIRTERDSPSSKEPQLQVAGAFTSGGASAQATQTRETAVEFIDDIVISRKSHLIKMGIQVNDYIETQHLPTNFNGTYVFGGGHGPQLDRFGTPIAGTDVVINGLEQYRRSIFHQQGGTPTAFTLTVGTPIIDFYQLRNVLYVEDQWKPKPNLQLSFGLRYATQTKPKSNVNFAPRVGVAWSPGKKQNWTFRGHIGLFTSRLTNDMYTAQQQADGLRRMSYTVYSPVYGDPFANATPVSNVRNYASGIRQTPSLQTQVGVEHTLPHRWNIVGSLSWIHSWDNLRLVNINSPLNQQPSGPRPGPADRNIYQYQQSGYLDGSILTVTVNQFSYRRFQIFGGYMRTDLRGNTDGTPNFSPQSSLTDGGEYARLTQSTHRFIGMGQLNLPWAVSVSTNLDAASGVPYNIVTGLDRNGDGIFNDRPEYVIPGDPNGIATTFGTLVSTGGIGIFPRNAGTMPWTIHLDMNVSRSFVLNPHAGPDHRQSIGVNIRSANVLNHTNVTGVGNVLGSSLFGRPYTSDAGRRVEVGLKYIF